MPHEGGKAAREIAARYLKEELPDRERPAPDKMRGKRAVGDATPALRIYQAFFFLIVPITTGHRPA